MEDYGAVSEALRLASSAITRKSSTSVSVLKLRFLQRIDQIRYQVNHLYGYYRGIQHAIEAYLQQRQTT